MKVNERTIHLLLFIVGLLSISVSLFYAVDIPLLDDYNLCLQFIADFSDKHSFREQIASIFSFNNGHPTVTQKVIFLLDWIVFRGVDFRHFIFINNVVHLLILFVLYRIFVLLGSSVHFFIPVAFLIAVPVFTLNNWSSSFMHLATLYAVLHSFYLLELGNKINFMKATVLAIFASLSSGAGILAFFAAVPILLRRYPRKYWYGWMIVALIIGVYYLRAYVTPSENALLHQTSIATYLVNFVVFFGSIFKSLYHDHHLWGVIFGILVLSTLLFIVLKIRSGLNEIPVLLSILIFSLMIGWLTTMMRSQFGLGATTAYRYRLYQALPVVFMLFTLAKFWKEHFKTNYYGILFCALLMLGFRWENVVHEFKLRKVQLKMGAMIYQGLNIYDELTFRNQAVAAQILQTAKEREIFQLDSKLQMSPKFEVRRQYTHSLITEFSEKVMTGNYIYLRGRSFLDGKYRPEVEIRIGYIDGDRIIHFPTIPDIEPTDLIPQPNGSFVYYQSHSGNEMTERSYYVIIYSSLQGILAMEEIQK